MANMPKPLTKTEKARKAELIRQLAQLSKNGWANARFDDYWLIEVELAKLSMRHRLAVARKVVS